MVVEEITLRFEQNVRIVISLSANGISATVWQNSYGRSFDTVIEAFTYLNKEYDNPKLQSFDLNSNHLIEFNK